MTKQRVRILIPLLIILEFLLNTLMQYFRGEFLPNWRHLIGLGGFLVLVYLYFKSLKWVVLGTGVYFSIAICNGLNMTAATITHWLGSGDRRTPPFQAHSVALFVLYLILNLDNLIAIQLDYKEAQKAKGAN